MCDHNIFIFHQEKCKKKNSVHRVIAASPTKPEMNEDTNVLDDIKIEYPCLPSS